MMPVRTEHAGLLLERVVQRFRGDHTTDRPHRFALPIQAITARSGFLAGIDPAASSHQPAGDPDQLAGQHLLRPLGQRPIQLRVHHHIARVYIYTQLDGPHLLARTRSINFVTLVLLSP
jgi:hypothetical protein